MPGALFPHPDANDALELSAFGPLLYLFTLGASLLSLVGVVRRGWKAEGTIGLGVFLLGVAAAFVEAIFIFGNFQNDRFAPLFLTPLLAAPIGMALAIVGLVMKSGRRGNPMLGALRGAAAASVVTVWILARGATNWLQAPYGFDVYVVITIAAAVVLYPGANSRRQETAAPT